MTPIILVDVDGTLVDVRPRVLLILDLMGLKPVAGGDPTAEIENLKPAQKDRFFSMFLSETYTHLDRPAKEVFDAILAEHRKTGLPVVILTGRPRAMAPSTMKLGETLKEMGVPVLDVIFKKFSEKFEPLPEFKIRKLIENRYLPEVVFEDDPRIIAAIHQNFPAARIHRVRLGARHDTERVA